jgi:hypothetical protein
MDRKSVIEIIVEKQGIDEKEAAKKLDSIVKAIKSKDKYAEFTDEEIYNVAATAINAKYNKPELDVGDEFVGVVVGIGNTFDGNTKVRRDAEAAFKKDPAWAEENKYVTYNNKGDPIYLDFRPTVGNGLQNWNFGKEIQKAEMRSIYMIVDEAVVEVMQTKIVPLTIGGEYAFNTKGDISKGRVNGSNFVYKGKYADDEMWSVMFSFDEYFDKVMGVPEVHNLPAREIVLTGGFVERAFPTKNGGFGITLSDDETITVFVNTPEVIEVAMNVDTGMELIIFGQTSVNNRDGGNNMTAYGIFVNPKSGEYNTLAHEFDSIL